MTAFTYQRDLDHPVSAEVEQTIRDVLEGLLSSQGMEDLLVIPGLDHDGDPALFIEIRFRMVKPGVDPKVLIQAGPALLRSLGGIGERRFPHLRYDFREGQKILGTESW